MFMNRQQLWLSTAFVTCVPAVGIPYWTIPYSLLTLPDALARAGLLALGIAALMLCGFAVARFWTVTFVLAASIPAAVFLRVVSDGLRDSTSHNLWPLEVMIAMGVGLICALPGAMAGNLLAKIIRHGRTKRRSTL